MSVNYLKIVNNLVDNVNSKYYGINKLKRNYWHCRSESISCRVRNKDAEIHAIQFAMNVRVFLLNEDKTFNIELNQTIEKIIKSDQHQLRMYAYSIFPNQSDAILDKNIGLIINSLTDEQIKDALDLKDVVSCRLLGYEKELFYLKCYLFPITPAFMLRCLYHLKYSHSKLEERIESEGLGDLKTGLDFDWYLDVVRFL